MEALRNLPAGTQKCFASIVLRQQFFCSLSLYKAMEGKLDEIAVMVKGSTTKINVGTKGKSFRVVTITGEESFTYKIALRRLRDLLSGEILEELDVPFRCYDMILPKILKLEKEFGGKIEYDKRFGKFRIYGSPETRKLLENKLKEIYEKFSENNTDRIMLKGKGRAPGLMKGLMKKYGPNLLQLMPSKDCGILELNVRDHVISISASNDVIEKVKKSVDEYNQQLQREYNLSLHQNEDKSDECPVCICQVEKPMFVLQSCGHAYCTECLKQYLKSSISDKKFPISCCEEKCGRRLVLKDFNLLIEGKTERVSLLESALDHFVMMNSTSYKYCPTPNCSIVYRISDEQMSKAFKCPDCSKETCTACHQDAHRNFSSCAAWREFNDDKDLYEWAGDKDCRKCPNCGAMIEKNGGCRHMACRCGSHICWGCMAVFLTDDECYNHQRSCTRILPPQTYQGPQTVRERPLMDADLRATTTTVAGACNRTDYGTTHAPRPTSSQNAAQTGRDTSVGVACAMATTGSVSSTHYGNNYETTYATRPASSQSAAQAVRGASVADFGQRVTTISAADVRNHSNYRLTSTSRLTSSQSVDQTGRDTSVANSGTRGTTSSVVDAHRRFPRSSVANSYNRTNPGLVSTSRPALSQNAIQTSRERNIRDSYRTAYDYDNHHAYARPNLGHDVFPEPEMYRYHNSEQQPMEDKKRNCTIL